MSETLRELIDNAEASGDWSAVADWCESFDWTQAREVPVVEFYLERAAAVAASGRGASAGPQQLVEAVTAARRAGASWERIGQILGTTGREAQQRYESLTDTAAAAAG